MMGADMEVSGGDDGELQAEAGAGAREGLAVAPVECVGGKHSKSSGDDAAGVAAAAAEESVVRSTNAAAVADDVDVDVDESSDEATGLSPEPPCMAKSASTARSTLPPTCWSTASRTSASIESPNMPFRLSSPWAIACWCCCR